MDVLLGIVCFLCILAATVLAICALIALVRKKVKGAKQFGLALLITFGVFVATLIAALGLEKQKIAKMSPAERSAYEASKSAEDASLASEESAENASRQAEIDTPKASKQAEIDAQAATPQVGASPAPINTPHYNVKFSVAYAACIYPSEVDKAINLINSGNTDLVTTETSCVFLPEDTKAVEMDRIGNSVVEVLVQDVSGNRHNLWTTTQVIEPIKEQASE